MKGQSLCRALIIDREDCSSESGVPPNNVLFGGTAPSNSMLFSGTVPSHTVLFGATVLPNSLSIFDFADGSMFLAN